MTLTEILKNHKLWAMGNGGSPANLSQYDLKKLNLPHSFLSKANFSGANLHRTKLPKSNLIEADLSGADLSFSDLSGCCLSGANLSGANLSGADLSRADLSGANLFGVNLQDADICRAYFFNAKGIYFFNKKDGETCYAIDHGSTLMIKAVCFWGTLDQFERKCKIRYDENEIQAYKIQIEYLRAILSTLKN